MKRFVFPLILLFSTFTFAQTNLPRTDTQSWNDVTITKPLIKAKDKKGKEFDKFSIFFTGTLRFGNHINTLIDERIGFGFDYKVNKYLTLTPSYAYRSNKPNLISRNYESFIRFAATLEKKWTKFSVKDRNMFEYRLRNSRPDTIRYRNKFTLAYSFLKDKKEIFAPFIADEVFYDSHDNYWQKNQFSVGITRKFNKNFSTDFFYMREDARRGMPRNINAFGVALKFKID